jgi:hypothetical protein
MEPVREAKATVTDLLDRLLETGVILDLDMIIGIAGVPLIGVSLRAAIAAIETMIEYGFMQTWDENTRRYAERELQSKRLPFGRDERTLVEMFGSHWSADGIQRAWRPGRLFVTNQRLILYRRMPAEVLFEAPLGRIAGLATGESVRFDGRRVPLLHITLDDGAAASFYAEDLDGLRSALEEQLAAMGVAVTATSEAWGQDCEAADAMPGAQILAKGMMWRQESGAPGIAAEWRPGILYLTDKGLLWWSQNRRRLELRIAASSILGVTAETHEKSALLPESSMLVVRWMGQDATMTSLFTGKAVEEWRRAIRRVAVDDKSGAAS